MTRPGLPVPYLQLCISEAAEKASTILRRDVGVQPLPMQVSGRVARPGAEGQLWKLLPPPPPPWELTTTV